MPRLQRLIFGTDQFQDESVSLNSDQIRYLYKVLRLKTGDQFIVMDGMGHWWLATLINQTRAQLIQAIEINNELSIPLILIGAPPKGNGFDTVIHCAIELGVHAIYPLLSERTLSQPNARKIARWQKIAMEATEQSHRQVVAKIHQPITFQTLGQPSQPWNRNAGRIFFCSTKPNLPQLHSSLLTISAQTTIKQITVITGPEGGWSAQEELQLIELGYTAISLGRRILRAVTAPINALSIAAAYCDINLT